MVRTDGPMWKAFRVQRRYGATTATTRRWPGDVASKAKMNVRFRVNTPTKDCQTRGGGDDFCRSLVKSIKECRGSRKVEFNICKSRYNKGSGFNMQLASEIELEKCGGEFGQAMRRGMLKEVRVKEFRKRVGIKRGGFLKHLFNLLQSLNELVRNIRERRDNTT